MGVKSPEQWCGGQFMNFENFAGIMAIKYMPSITIVLTNLLSKNVLWRS